MDLEEQMGGPAFVFFYGGPIYIYIYIYIFYKNFFFFFQSWGGGGWGTRAHPGPPFPPSSRWAERVKSEKEGAGGVRT
jgi:hypothetical protein